jgi:predicted flap endonuclease-1-like 5' DNA nuclease
MTYPISRLDGCGCTAELVKILKSNKIRTTRTLLEAAKTPKGRQQLADRTGIDAKHILRLANAADRMRIKGVGKENAELLEAAGVNTVRELKYRNPENLAGALAEANRKRKLVRTPPSAKAVGRWIDEAKKIQIKISY